MSLGRVVYLSLEGSRLVKVVLASAMSLSSLASSWSCFDVSTGLSMVACTFLISWAEYFGVHDAVLYAVLISLSGA